jgi:hypothetical protein
MRHPVGHALSALAGLLLAVPTVFLPATATAAAKGTGREAPSVWVHYDYMVDSTGRSDAPDPDAIQQVVTAYARHGVELIIDPQHTAIPASHLVVPDFDPDFAKNSCAGDGSVNFSDLKATYFHPTSSHPWHYAIFGEYIAEVGAYLCASQLTGHAELPGFNFVVTLGNFRDQGASPATLARWSGSTFMHELGHNLGLRHGGNVSLPTDKPNYLSVMNYEFQGGIPYARHPGSTMIAGFRLDYSDAALPTLDESHLDETKGIGATGSDITVWAGEYGAGIAAVEGPIDWNNSGASTDTDVAVDLDFGFCDPVCTTVPEYAQLAGFNDWAEVRAYLANPVSAGARTFERDLATADGLRQ